MIEINKVAIKIMAGSQIEESFSAFAVYIQELFAVYGQDFCKVIFLLPNGSGLSATDKIKEIIVIVFVWSMALIANTLNIVTIVLRKK